LKELSSNMCLVLIRPVYNASQGYRQTSTNGSIWSR
jgi:hypothetical protein